MKRSAKLVAYGSDELAKLRKIIVLDERAGLRPEIERGGRPGEFEGELVEGYFNEIRERESSLSSK